MTNLKLNLIALFISFFFQNSFAGVNPDIDWETISTPHFEIIFDARHYSTARMYALRMELNYKLLSGYFIEAPEKTILIINDNTDLSNGYATSMPYPHIMAYPVLPLTNDSIGEYSDWPMELTLHEYAHILNFEPAHGFMKFLRAVMGSIITPTMLLPRWWHEGLAVEMETRFSSHGRLRSSYQDASLRALVLENQLDTYSIADINESSLDTWPRGARPYLFGSLLMSEIQAQKGGTINNTLLQRFSSRPPYLINTPTEEETGQNFESWFKETIKNINDRTQNQLTLLKQTPPTAFQPLSTNYLQSRSPQVSPDGRFLVFIAENTWGKSSIQILDRHNENRPFNFENDSYSEFLSIDNKGAPTNKEAPPSGTINRMSWRSDSKGFFFDQVRYSDSYSNFSDLYFYDLSAHKTKRITTGLRLREPTISFDGLTLAAVQLEQSNTKLVSVNNEGKELKNLYTPPPLIKLSSPLFLADGSLLFIEQNLQGNSQLKEFNLQTQQIHAIEHKSLQKIRELSTNSEINNSSPNIERITFVAEENGIPNLYITVDRFKSYERLTHTLTGIFTGVLDPRISQIYGGLMTEKGLQIMTADRTKESIKTPPPALKPLLAERYEPIQYDIPNETSLESEFGSLISEKETYESTKYLRPRYWLPFAYVSDTGYGTQISTSSFDPLEKQSYSIQAGYDSFAKESNIGLGYGNTMTRWPFSFLFNSEHRDPPNLNARYESDQFDFLATHDLRPWSEYSNIGIGLEARRLTSVSATSTSKKQFGPQFIYTYDGTAKSAFSQIPFAGTQLAFYGKDFVKSKETSKLTQGIVSATYFHSKYLPERQIVLIHGIAQKIQGEITDLYDLSSSDSYHLDQNFVSPKFVLRGYDPGYFYFKSAQGATFEYHIPLYGYKGWGTLPVFLKKTRLNFYYEALSIDGIVSDKVNKKYIIPSTQKVYASYGAEFKADITLGYYFPLTWVLGIYHRPDYSGADKTTGFLGIQI